MQFIGDEIFPGGSCPRVEDIENFPRTPGSLWQRIHLLRPHYARTLDMWAANLVAVKDEAIAITSEEVYDRYLHYLTGCADFFRRGIPTSASSPLVKGDMSSGAAGLSEPLLLRLDVEIGWGPRQVEALRAPRSAAR